MTHTAAPVGRLVLRTFLWLPLCFAAWYVAAPFLGRIVGDVGGMLVELIRSNLVSAIEWQAPYLEFVTSLRVHSEADRIGVLVVEVNPLLYTYGLPLFVALMLAARAKAWMILAGIALLLPFQAWGVAFDLLVQLGVKSGADISVRAGLAGWRAEVIALAYQLGSLVFPALIPVALWVAFNRGRLPVLGALPATSRALPQ